MANRYCIPASQESIEINIKNSRFIAHAQAVQSAADVTRHLHWCREQWPGAHHYCTAAQWGAPGDSQRYAMSDDGEPSGTAGRPMFNVIQSSGIGEISVVVVRYFGGIKLGTGGLQRAYSQATAELLKILPTIEKVLRKPAHIHYDYPDQNVVQHTLQRYEAIVTEQQFSEVVEAELAVVASTVSELATDLKNATQGRVELTIRNGDS